MVLLQFCEVIYKNIITDRKSTALAGCYIQLMLLDFFPVYNSTQSPVSHFQLSDFGHNHTYVNAKPISQVIFTKDELLMKPCYNLLFHRKQMFYLFLQIGREQKAKVHHWNICTYVTRPFTSITWSSALQPCRLTESSSSIEPRIPPSLNSNVSMHFFNDTILTMWNKIHHLLPSIDQQKSQ